MSEADRLRIAGLENQLATWRSRALYAEHELQRQDEMVCPMAIGDPHNTCGLAEALSDTLAAAIGRDATLSDWLDERSKVEDADAAERFANPPSRPSPGGKPRPVIG